MKKIFFIVFIIAFIFFSFSSVFAACQTKDMKNACPDCPKSGGLVPCGRNCDDPGTSDCECEPCTLCHFFVLIDRIIDFLLLPPPAGGGIVPGIAVLMIAAGGMMYIFAVSGGGEMALISKAKSLFLYTAIGLLIIYGAWLFVNLFFMLIGVQKWTNLNGGWWSINCGQ